MSIHFSHHKWMGYPCTGKYILWAAGYRPAWQDPSLPLQEGMVALPEKKSLYIKKPRTDPGLLFTLFALSESRGQTLDREIHPRQGNESLSRVEYYSSVFASAFGAGAGLASLVFLVFFLSVFSVSFVLIRADLPVKPRR